MDIDGLFAPGIAGAFAVEAFTPHHSFICCVRGSYHHACRLKRSVGRNAAGIEWWTAVAASDGPASRRAGLLTDKFRVGPLAPLFPARCPLPSSRWPLLVGSIRPGRWPLRHARFLRARPGTPAACAPVSSRSWTRPFTHWRQEVSLTYPKVLTAVIGAAKTAEEGDRKTLWHGSPECSVFE